jgi:quinol monooxygenase YgiN
MMNYESRILEYIQVNEPCTRKDLLKEYPYAAPKTVYQSVRKLIAGKKIFLDEHGHLTTRAESPVWAVPPTLIKFINLSPIVNAFARQHKELDAMASKLSRAEEERATVLLTDLMILLNLHNENRSELAKRFEDKEKVDVHELTKYFEKLQETVSEYSKAKLINTNSN